MAGIKKGRGSVVYLNGNACKPRLVVHSPFDSVMFLL